MRDPAAALAEREAQGLYRRRRTLTALRDSRVRLDGRPLLAFCSNDYLGLAGDPRIARALQEGADRWGTGAGSAHLVCGHYAPHEALEEALAEFTGRPRALLFSTGYMANLGVIQALVGRGDRLWEDRLNHASLIDGALLARARLRRYPHLDPSPLEADRQAPRVIATDGLFSMDGDLAPLPRLADLARELGAWLLVDDAHGLGVLGANGGGTLEHFGLGVDRVPLLMGTLGKAFGVFGAFVAAPEPLIETLIQHARSYIYTTAPPPALAVATLKALEIVRTEGWRRAHLNALVALFREEAERRGLPLMDSATPIQPLLAGSAARALAWSRALEERGFLVPAIRPPTVPGGRARLRITLSAAQRPEQVLGLVEALAATREDLPEDPCPA